MVGNPQPLVQWFSKLSPHGPLYMSKTYGGPSLWHNDFIINEKIWLSKWKAFEVTWKVMTKNIVLDIVLEKI